MKLFTRIKRAFTDPVQPAQREPAVVVPTEHHSLADDLPTGTQAAPSRPPRSLKFTLTAIGRLDSVCPHCTSVLSRRPERKAVCPHCGQPIFVRTRPLDRKRVLVTEVEAETIDEEWSNFSGGHIDPHIDSKALARHRQEFKRTSGCEPSEGDAVWSMLNLDLMQYAKKGDWGLYRNTRLSMAAVLEQEEKDLDALNTYLEVCYLDLNGPRNIGGLHDPDCPPFSVDEAFVAPAIEGKVTELLARLRLDEFQAQRAFTERAQRVHRNLRLPVSPEEAWRTLSNLLYVESGE